MKAVRRFIALFRDSPTYGRDRANLISGFSIGTAGLLLNGAVMMLVLPLMLDPDDRSFRELTENVEMGQLLALILLGGATVFATVLIPLRLVSVFWGPRTGRYFDQIVLSGISPLRYVIGKALSQNLFLGLIAFLLLPYFVLSLTMGGVNWVFFLAGLFLVWLYSMTLALVTLWVSLYVNELLAAVLVISAAIFLSVLGCIPMPLQPFVLTPFPALMHSLYSSIPALDGRIPEDFFPVFASCATSMTVVIGISLLAIYLGPLYGIIRDNSTFGEVVRPGDSKKKRWLRLRLHIQRPSEIAFFYENRSRTFRRYEGLIRWGIEFGGLVLILGAAYWVFVYLYSTALTGGGGASPWWVYEFHTIYLVIHGFGLIFGIFLFSHSRNSTYLRLPFVRGRMAEVSRLDTTAFLLFALVSTGMSIATPFLFEHFIASPNGNTVFPDLMYVTQGKPIDYVRVAAEGSAVLSVAGLVIYAFHRYVSLMAWTRSASLMGVAGAYFLAVCILPVFFGVLFMEIQELRQFQFIADRAPMLMMSSPFMVIIFLFNDVGGGVPEDASVTPFYVVHGLLLGLTILGIRRRGRKLREEYLVEPVRETN